MLIIIAESPTIRPRLLPHPANAGLRPSFSWAVAHGELGVGLCLTAFEAVTENPRTHWRFTFFTILLASIRRSGEPAMAAERGGSNPL
jgi:hypothetical protein